MVPELKQRSLGSQILWVWVPGMEIGTGMGRDTSAGMGTGMHIVMGTVRVQAWVPCLGYGYGY